MTLQTPRMLERLGFSTTHYVLGRASIADLFPKDERCGIYVLHFTDGWFYAGKAVNVVSRFNDHRKNHPDIEQLSFQKVPRDKLGEVEPFVIDQLHLQVKLRNIKYVTLPELDNDFDLIMSREEQARWLTNSRYVYRVGSRVHNPEQRQRYHRKFQKFIQHHSAHEIIAFLHKYVERGIPAPIASEMSFWNCTILSAKDVLCRLNLYQQEVLTLFEESGKVNVSFQLARSPFGRSLWRLRLILFLRYSSVSIFKHYYPSGGQDQFRLEVRDLDEATRLLDIPGVVSTIRMFNLGLCRKGPCANGQRFHCLDLADYLVAGLRSD